GISTNARPRRSCARRSPPRGSDGCGCRSSAGARTSWSQTLDSRASFSRSPSAASRSATRRTGWSSSPGRGSSGTGWCARRSVGSCFVNPVLPAAAFDELVRRWRDAGELDPIPTFPADGRVKVPAAWLIEHAGFAKGYRQGGVGISTRHALALVNHGGTTTELLALAQSIDRAVYARFG